MIIVHYEVYVLEGRGWMLHARFPRTEREGALAEAKELEQTLKIKVRVVRETYYTDNNAFDEAEVYVTGGRIPDKAGAGSGGGGASPRPSGGKRMAAAGASGAKAKSRTVRSVAGFKPVKSKAALADIAQTRQAAARLLAVCAVALAVAFFAVKITPNIILLLWRMGFGIKVSADSYSQLLLVIFVLAFVMTAVPLGMKFMPGRNAAARSTVAAAPSPVRRVQARSNLSRDMKKSLDKLAKEAEKTPAPVVDEDLPPLPDDLPDLDFSIPDETAKSESDFGRPEAEAPAEGGVSVESQIPKVSKFLDGALEECRNEKVSMDNYNRFALHLYMAGAVEALVEFRKLGSAAKVKMMVDALDVLGTRGAQAANFHDKLPEYRREARYMAVFEAGRTAMGNYMLGDEMGAHIALRDVFRDWNRKVDQKQNQMMTVLFTDMVDSTNMTQIRGDAAAQEVVRRHNLIVRNALSKFGGHEVKHTGDGIMASFLSAAGALDAMIVVQRQIAEHNARMPTQTLNLRIGLNAGEPIQEEDDLFGSTVQLAARVCAAAGTDEILCTASVMELADKPGAMFVSVGAKAVKGFRDPITMYRVNW